MTQPVVAASSDKSARRRSFKGLAMGLVLGIAAAASVPVLAVGMGYHGPHGGHHMMGGGGFMGGSPERVDRMVERMLEGIDATEQQRTQIRQIAQAAAKDLQGQREAGRKLHEQMRTLFTQPTVDAAAVESLRQQSVAHMDAVSRRTTQAMVDAARVLTPEQRAQIGQRMAERQRRFEERMQERQQRRPEGAPRQP